MTVFPLWGAANRLQRPLGKTGCLDQMGAFNEEQVLRSPLFGPMQLTQLFDQRILQTREHRGLNVPRMSPEFLRRLIKILLNSLLHR
jgi:hypothetical protein